MPATTAADLQPYEFEEYLVWSLGRGVAGRVGEEDVQRWMRSLDKEQARKEFAAGLLAGASKGARDRFNEEVADTLQLLQGGMNWVLEGYSMVYNPVVLKELVRAVFVAKGATQQAQAMASLALEPRVHHPAVTVLLDSLAELLPQLEAFAVWLSKEPRAMRLVLGAIAHDLGDLIGDVWVSVVSLTGKPRAQGEAAGHTLGRFTMDVALYLVGF